MATKIASSNLRMRLATNVVASACNQHSLKTSNKHKVKEINTPHDNICNVYIYP